MQELFIRDKWMSNIIEVESYTLNENEELIQSQIQEFIKNAREKSFFTAKVSTNNIKDILILQNCGFKIIDTLINYNLELKNICTNNLTYNLEKFTIREANKDDHIAVSNLASNSFKLSRFYLDPEIDNYFAKKIKYEWAANYFNGKRGNKLFVIDSELDKIIAGFILLIENVHPRKEMNSVIIDLISINPKFYRMGLAFNLVKHTLSHYKNNFKRIEVGTQAVNIAANNLYQKLNFNMNKSSYVMHLHKNENR